MSREFIGFILETVGKILVSYTALKVHYRFLKEHKIDEVVFREMKREQIIGIIGIFSLSLVIYFKFPKNYDWFWEQFIFEKNSRHLIRKSAASY